LSLTLRLAKRGRFSKVSRRRLHLFFQSCAKLTNYTKSYRFFQIRVVRHAWHKGGLIEEDH